MGIEGSSRICVLGLGYVGTVASACLADLGHRVVAVDVDHAKVRAIQSGEAPIPEKGLAELVKRTTSSGMLTATTESAEGIAGADCSLVCVGTPSTVSGEVDLTHVLQVARDIGRVLQDSRLFQAVVFRSTVTPGTTAACGELIAKASGRQLGIDFGVVANPEFLREGSAVGDFFNPPYTVIGAECERASAMVERLYHGVRGPIVRTSIRVAEFIKYANNAFHAMKVSFANEVGVMCKALDVNSYDLMELFCKDFKLNLSPYYLKPGFAFGGSCLPKDTRALLHLARKRGLSIPLLEGVFSSNAEHIERAVSLIRGRSPKAVLIVGLSFKENTDDLRESPLIELAKRIESRGIEVCAYDPDLDLSAITGSNRAFVERAFPRLAERLVTDFADAAQRAQLIVLGKRVVEVVEWLQLATRKPCEVVDLVGLREVEKPGMKDDWYAGIAW